MFKRWFKKSLKKQFRANHCNQVLSPEIDKLKFFLFDLFPPKREKGFIFFSLQTLTYSMCKVCRRHMVVNKVIEIQSIPQNKYKKCPWLGGKVKWAQKNTYEKIFFTVSYCNFAPKSLRIWLPLILLQSSKPTSRLYMILFQSFWSYGNLPINL